MPTERRNRIGVIAPSAPIHTLNEHVIETGLKKLRELGFEVFVHPQVYAVTGYTAGTAKERADAIHELVERDDIDIIMSFWGGDNSNQLLELLDYELIRRKPKIFVGYSDMSSLLLGISKMAGLVTYLGPGVITFTKPHEFPETFEYLKRVAIDSESRVSLTPPETYASDAFYLNNDNSRTIRLNEGWLCAREGEVLSKRIVAGNLSMLESLIGTPYEPDWNDSILFCEADENISTQVLDRILTHFKYAGVLGKLAGLVFSKTMDSSSITTEDIKQILRSKIEDGIPVVYNFDAGHTDPILTIPIGGKCDLSAGISVSVTVYP